MLSDECENFLAAFLDMCYDNETICFLDYDYRVDNETICFLDYCVDDKIINILEELEMDGLIASPDKIDGIRISFVLVIERAREYFSQKEHDKARACGHPNVAKNTLNAPSANLNFSSLVNSQQTIENTFAQAEREIDEKGGADKDDLLKILQETKSLCNKIIIERTVPKANLFEKASAHFAKYDWFYKAVVQVVGAAVLKIL